MAKKTTEEIMGMTDVEIINYQAANTHTSTEVTKCQAVLDVRYKRKSLRVAWIALGISVLALIVSSLSIMLNLRLI